MLMGLDAEKAFDSVRWAFLYKVLEKSGFHYTIIQAIKTLYTINPRQELKLMATSPTLLFWNTCTQ